MLDTAPLSPALGVEVKGVDLRRLSDEEGAALVRLLRDEFLLLLRGQELSADDQVRAISRFGDIADELGNGTQSYYISNVREDGTLGEVPLPFHSDWTWTPVPVFVAALYGEEVRGPAAPTRFNNTARAYAELPDELKRRIADLRALHMNSPKAAMENDMTRQRLADLPEDVTIQEVPRATQRVVLEHPVYGTPLLFVNELWVSHIIDVPAEESEALLSELFARLGAPDNVYEHHWVEGDCVIWDNLAVQHGRPSFAGLGARRTLRRVSTSERGASPLRAVGWGLATPA